MIFLPLFVTQSQLLLFLGSSALKQLYFLLHVHHSLYILIEKEMQQHVFAFIISSEMQSKDMSAIFGSAFISYNEES